jgi:hypothetical protein
MLERIVGGRLIALSLLAGIILPASSPLAAAPPSPGGIGVRLIALPADPSVDPRARVYIVERLAPGKTIRRSIEIINSTRSTATVAVYPAAASLQRGQFIFAPGRSRNELSAWSTVSRKVLRIPARTKVLETVTIRVPKKVALGERYAVIWAEVSAPSAKTGVTLVNRVGVRMYLSIGLGGAPPSNFAIGSLTAQRSPTGQPLVVAKIRNQGRTTIGISSGDLTLSNGPGGIRTGPFAVKRITNIAPGHSEQLIVRLNSQLPLGPWRAQLRLRSGLVQRVATATIRFPAAS